MPRKFNDPLLQKFYQKMKLDADAEGFTEEELSSHWLDKISKQTKSRRIDRLIRWAYYLGCMRGIDFVDEMKTRVSLRELDQQEGTPDVDR
jgi:hypothetical protein